MNRPPTILRLADDATIIRSTGDDQDPTEAIPLVVRDQNDGP